VVNLRVVLAFNFSPSPIPSHRKSVKLPALKGGAITSKFGQPGAWDAIHPPTPQGLADSVPTLRDGF